MGGDVARRQWRIQGEAVGWPPLYWPQNKTFTHYRSEVVTECSNGYLVD